jgi:hypothetical protein
VNSEPLPERLIERYREEGSEPVRFDEAACRELAPNTIAKPLMATGHFVRHDPQRLAQAVVDVLQHHGV